MFVRVWKGRGLGGSGEVENVGAVWGLGKGASDRRGGVRESGEGNQ